MSPYQSIVAAAWGSSSVVFSGKVIHLFVMDDVESGHAKEVKGEEVEEEEKRAPPLLPLLV